MKKALVYLSAFSALIAVSVSCQKEVLSVTDQVSPQQADKIRMTIVAAGDAETRTILQEDGKTVLWDSDEQLAVLETVGESTNYAASSTGVSTDSGNTMTFDVEFDAAEGSSFTYNAIYPNSSYVTSTNTNPASLKVITPTTQKATASSYDGDADLLIAKPVTTTSQQTNLNLAFKRMVVVGKMTLNNVQTNGFVKSVKFSSANKIITGKSKINLTTGQAVEYGYEGTGNRVDYVEVTYAANDIPANNLTVYFTCLPFEITAGEKFMVTLTTKDDKTFTREVTIPEGRKLSFALGKNTKFSVDMTDAISGEITSLAGKNYVIVARYFDTDNNVYSGNYSYLTSTLSSTSTTYYFNGTTSISATEDIDVTNSKVDFPDISDYWAIEAKGDNYAIKSITTEKYISYGGTGNSASQSTEPYELKITAVDDVPGLYKVSSVADASRRLQYNGKSPRFAFYTGTQNDIFLIPVGEDVTPANLVSISVSGQTTIFNVGDAFSFDGTVTANYDDGSTKNVTSKATVSTPEMATAGTKTVTVSFEGKEVTYEITVNEKAIVYPVTDVLTLATTGVSGSSYTSWEDKTASSLAKYSGNSAGGNSSIQLRKQSPSGIITTSSGGYATKVIVTWESHTSANRTLNVYGKNTAYSSPADLYGDDPGTIIGTIVKGESTELDIPYDCQFIGLCSNEGAMYISEIKIIWSDSPSGNPIPTPKYNVNIANNITNGSVVADKTTDILAGESVTLTVTANQDYKLLSLTVDGVDVASSVDAEGKYTFSMPAHDVLVAAQFQSTIGSTVVFLVSDFSGQGTSSTGSEISSTKDGITFSCDKGFGTTQIRCYKNGVISVNAESGKTITGISFTIDGSYTGGLESSYSGLSTDSWSMALSSQARFTEISVSYQ